MESIPLSTMILSILAKEHGPLSLADICKKLKDHTISKPTVYRHLQELVSSGMISKKDEDYILIQGGDPVIIAGDFARMSELKPIISEAQRGFRMTAYSLKDSPLKLDKTELKKDMQSLLCKYLSKLNPVYSGICSDQHLAEDDLKKLVGIKFVLVTSFDGTDFSAFSSSEKDILSSKRREALDLIDENDGLTINELNEKLGLNALQIRQVIDPILASGFVIMDETGKLRCIKEED